MNERQVLENDFYALIDRIFKEFYGLGTTEEHKEYLYETLGQITDYQREIVDLLDRLSALKLSKTAIAYNFEEMEQGIFRTLRIKMTVFSDNEVLCDLYEKMIKGINLTNE